MIYCFVLCLPAHPFRVAVYHYVTKSKEEFQAKVQRGGGAGVTRSMDYFDTLNAQALAQCEGAAETKKRLCSAGYR